MRINNFKRIVLSVISLIIFWPSSFAQAPTNQDSTDYWFEEWRLHPDSLAIGFSENSEPLARHILAVCCAIECYMIMESSITCSADMKSMEKKTYRTSKKCLDYDIVYSQTTGDEEVVVLKILNNCKDSVVYNSSDYSKNGKTVLRNTKMQIKQDVITPYGKKNKMTIDYYSKENDGKETKKFTINYTEQ